MVHKRNEPCSTIEPNNTDWLICWKRGYKSLVKQRFNLSCLMLKTLLLG